MVLLSLDEVDRVKRINNITSTSGFEDKTGITRKTWGKALNTRKPTMTVIEALVELGARPSKILVLDKSIGQHNHAA